MNRCFEILSRLGVVLAGGATVLMMVHVTLDSFLRSFANAPTLGTIEIVSFYYMVAAIFVGIFVATYENQHLAVDVVYSILSSKLQRICRVAVGLVSIGYLSTFAYALVRQAVKKTAVNEEVDAIVANLTIWPARWLAALAIVAMAALILWRFMNDLRHGFPDDADKTDIAGSADNTPEESGT